MNLFIKTSLLSFALLFVGHYASAQKIGDPYPKDRVLIDEGVVLHDDDKYADAIEKFKMVNPNDSFYVEALYELSNSYLADKQYELCRKTALKGLQMETDMRRLFLIMYANALEELDQLDTAIATYNQGLREFPYHNAFEYEKGLSYGKKKRWADAFNAYTLSAKSNIMHPATHLRIGFMAADARQPTLALMALQMYIILNNDASNLISVIDKMEKVGGNEYLVENEIPDVFTNKDFSEIDEILLSKAAYSGKYKGKTNLNYGIIKQMQVLMEKLPADYHSDIWMYDFYVNFYAQLWKDGHFEGAMLHSMSALDSKEVQREVKAKVSKITAFQKWANKYLTAIRNDKPIMVNGKEVKSKLWYDGNSLEAIGEQNDKDEQVGYWVFFDNGYKSAEGSFEAGKKTGKWQYYYHNGQTKILEYYKDGKTEGEYTGYYDNGALKETSTYKEDKLNGLTTTYNPNGTVKSKMTLKDNILEGVRYNYTSTGMLSTEGEMKNDKYSGYYKSYYATGEINLKCTAADDEINGEAINYYRNGKIKNTGTYTAGKQTGMWKWYDEHGKLESEGSYLNDKETGTWKYYYPDGKLKSESNYENGKLKGLSKSYDEDGKLYDESVYKNNKIDSYKYYAADGKIIAQGKASSGKVNFVRYNIFRNKTAEGQVVNGLEEGVWKFYYDNGALQYEQPYTKGSREGITKYYYKNGKTYYELNYASDMREGFYRSYFMNGNIQSEGYYHYDEQVGPWSFYFSNGNLSTVEFYEEGTVVGTAEDYDANGKLSATMSYNHGFFNNRTQFDSTGKVYSNTKLKLGTGDYELVGLNRKAVYKGKYVGGKKSGVFTTYYGNGVMKNTQDFVVNERLGTYKGYHENGKLSAIGNYKNDEADSIWTYYDENGRLFKWYTYKNDELNGMHKVFYDNGKPEIERNYREGERHGEYTYYGYDGSVIMIATYENGVMKGYTYLGKDNKPVPFIPLVNETGEIKTFYANGNKGLSYTIDRGLIQGKFLVYYPDGKLYSETDFEDGNYHGNDKTWYANGNLKAHDMYYYDDLNGMSTSYHENGKVSKQIPYMLDYRYGAAKYYDNTGKLIKTTTYIFDDIYEQK
jgi:antitoxin component YwqK of YwqJK toxin-antitoxin module